MTSLLLVMTFISHFPRMTSRVYYTESPSILTAEMRTETKIS